MNKSLFTFSLLFVSCICFSQQKVKKNELSLSFLKISNSPFYSYPGSQKPFGINPGINAIYKYRLRDDVYLRASQSYYNYSNMDNVYGFIKTKNITEINTSAGIEFRYTNDKLKRFNFFTGADLAGFFNTNKLKTKEQNLLSYTLKGMGVQTFAGINFYPTRRMVISLESSALLAVGETSYKEANAQGKVVFSTIPISEMFGQIFLIRAVSFGWVF